MASSIVMGLWALGSAGAVAITIATVFAVQALGPAACAAVPANTVNGSALHYRLAGQGTCNLPPPPGGLYAAVNPNHFSSAEACGAYLSVSGPDGTVQVKIIDRCYECTSNQIKLGDQAFDRIAELRDSVANVRFGLIVNPAISGPITVYFDRNSTEFWAALRLDNTGNPVRSVEINGGNGWRSLYRTDQNQWIAENPGRGPFSLRIVDREGHVATPTGVTLRPGHTQTTNASMYGGSSGGDPAGPGGPGGPGPGDPGGGGAGPGGGSGTTTGGTTNGGSQPSNSSNGSGTSSNSNSSSPTSTLTNASGSVTSSGTGPATTVVPGEWAAQGPGTNVGSPGGC